MRRFISIKKIVKLYETPDLKVRTNYNPSCWDTICFSRQFGLFCKKLYDFYDLACTVGNLC